MQKQGHLEDKKVLLIDPDEKKENDKTFCFWANEEDSIIKDYAPIVSNSWKKIQINGFQPSDIAPLEYYHLSSLDLYEMSREIIKTYHIIHVKEKVLGVFKSDNKLFIESENSVYSSAFVFDGRPPYFDDLSTNDFNISQSFFGYKIKLEYDKFNDQVYHMMDFRVNQSKATQFIYILPYSKSEALVELTRFGKQLLCKDEAKEELNKFISKNYGSYEILDQESGVIPMSSVLPKSKTEENWINIGTRAGNVKPSTGYAFKNMYRHAKEICRGGRINAKKVTVNKRFLFYDQLLLIILTLWPLKGKPIFEQLFKAKSAHFVLRFLDEKTTLFEELSMFGKLQIWYFIKALIFWFYLRIKLLLIPFLMVFSLLIFWDKPSSYTFELHFIQLILLVIGLITIGIPHGALDHLTGFISKEKKITLKFILVYLSMMVPVFLLWLGTPSLALILFIIYSAWHFGQTDIAHWGIKSKLIGFLWGGILLSYLFITHPTELEVILNALLIELPYNFESHFFISKLLIVSSLFMAIYYKKSEWVLTTLFLFLSQYVNLIFAFGMYFIFQHSRLGWLHLKKQLNLSHFKMFLKALPFNIGAWLLFWVFALNFEMNIIQNIAYFFVFLSCVSFPHVVSMSVFYKNNN